MTALAHCRPQDFDVHHGQGTQANVQSCIPTVLRLPLHTSMFDGTVRVPSYKPWLDEEDQENVFFASGERAWTRHC